MLLIVIPAFDIRQTKLQNRPCARLLFYANDANARREFSRNKHGFWLFKCVCFRALIVSTYIYIVFSMLLLVSLMMLRWRCAQKVNNDVAEPQNAYISVWLCGCCSVCVSNDVCLVLCILSFLYTTYDASSHRIQSFSQLACSVQLGLDNMQCVFCYTYVFGILVRHFCCFASVVRSWEYH